MNAISYLPIALFLLAMYAYLGFARRYQIRPSGHIKTTVICSIVGLLFGLFLCWNTDNQEVTWLFKALILFTLGGGPWLAELVALIPSRKKVLARTLNQQYWPVQEAAVIVQIGGAIGNGFFVAPGLIVTCCHVVTADIVGRLRVHGGSGWMDAEVVHLEPGCDLVLLKCVGRIHPHAVMKLAQNSDGLKDGDTVTHVGYTDPGQRRPAWREEKGSFKFKGNYRVWKGECQPDQVPEQENLAIIVLDLPARKGHSGSAVLNEQDEAIGVVSGGGDGNETVLIPVEAVHAALASK